VGKAARGGCTSNKLDCTANFSPIGGVASGQDDFPSVTKRTLTNTEGHVTTRAAKCWTSHNIDRA